MFASIMDTHEYFIMLTFNSNIKHNDIIDFTKRIFYNPVLTCTDCMKVIQYMRESYRGYLIALGKKTGRAPIKTIEEARNNFSYTRKEFIASFKNTPVCARVLDSMHLFAIADSDWITEFTGFLHKQEEINKVELSISEPKYEILGFYADIERRLEEGDIVDGEAKSRERPVGDFENRFPQYCFWKNA